jgi:hypothetical protein
MKLETKNGYIFQIDQEDYDKIRNYPWYGYKSTYRLKNGEKKQCTKYIVAHISANERVNLHKLIMNTPVEIRIDHKNGDGLDNRKSNLRICTQSQNQMNKLKNCNNKSGYKGVSWDKTRNKWRSFIMLAGKNKCLGRFNSPEQAALAYNRAATKHFGEFAKLNKVESSPA